MKPRLPSAPPTDEDVQIWVDTCARAWIRGGVHFANALVNPDADRRDADLMLAFGELRRDIGPTYVTIAHAAVRGALARENDTGITWIGGYPVFLA